MGHLERRATILCHQDIWTSIPDRVVEKRPITGALSSNGYPIALVKKNWHLKPHSPTPLELDTPKAMVVIPYVKHLSESIQRILSPLKIRTCFRPHRTLRQALVNLKAQAEKINAVSRGRIAKSSTKCSRSKGNSLPPTKRFAFTMVDDDLRSRSVVSPLKKQTQTQRNVWNSSKTRSAQGTITGAQPLNWCQMIFSSLTSRCNSLKSSSTMVLSNLLAGGRLLPLLQECLDDLAILCQLKARYQLQVCNPQPAHSTIQTTCAFSGRLFLVNHLLHAFNGVLRTLLHETRGRKAPEGKYSKRNTPLKACSNNYLLHHAWPTWPHTLLASRPLFFPPTAISPAPPPTGI